MASPAAIIERVREIHRSFQEQIEAKRAQQVPPSTTTLGSTKAKDEGQAGDITNEYRGYYAPNSFVGQWLDKHPDTTLKDLSLGASTVPLRSFLGQPTSPHPIPEVPAFTGITYMSKPEAPQTALASDGDGNEGEGDPMAELVALGSAAEVSQWLAAVRELQVGGRTAANDWSASEQRQVEAMVQEEMLKAEAASKVEDDTGYQRIMSLQTIAEQLGAISKRNCFDEMPDSAATIDEWLDDLKQKVGDWYLNRKEVPSEGQKTEVKTAATKQRLNQISSGLASAAAHEGLLLTAQQLDQVLTAFYQQSQRKAPTSTTETDGKSQNGLGSPLTQRAVARLSRQLIHAQAREDAIRRVMGARNKALSEEIARLGQLLEAVAEYGHNPELASPKTEKPFGSEGRSSLRGSLGRSGAATLGESGKTANSNESGVMNLVQMMADRSSASGSEDYGISSILRNRGAVESLNAITFVVAEALSRKRMRTLQAQVEKLKVALTTMKDAYSTASERLQNLSTENARLKGDLDDFTKTFAKWKEIKDAQDAERKRLAREGGTELGLQKEVINRLVQRSATLFGHMLSAMNASTVTASSPHPSKYLSHHDPSYSNRRASLAAPVSPRHQSSRPTSPTQRLIAIPTVLSPTGGHRPSIAIGTKAGSPSKRMSILYPEVDFSSRRSSIGKSSEDGCKGPRTGLALQESTAMSYSILKRAAQEVHEWVSFARNTFPSDGTKMLLSDLDQRALTQINQWSQDGAEKESPRKKVEADSGGQAALIESLSHRLDQTVCEVKDKFREERFMRTTIKYFVQRVEEMCAGTYKEDPHLEPTDDSLSMGSGTTLTGVRSPLDKLKPLASITHTKVFPPKSITVPDTEYSYAWTDETDSLQRLFLSLKAILMHEVERTETTNAIVGALEKYNEEGPSYKNTKTPILPPIQRGDISNAPGAKTAPKGAIGQSLGDPLGLLQKVKLVNEREAERMMKPKKKAPR